MEDVYELNDGHIIEALDRLYVTQAYIEGVLINHALIDAVPEYLKKVNQIQSLLAALYQEVGGNDTIPDIKSKYQLTDGYC